MFIIRFSEDGVTQRYEFFGKVGNQVENLVPDLFFITSGETMWFIKSGQYRYRERSLGCAWDDPPVGVPTEVVGSCMEP